MALAFPNGHPKGQTVDIVFDLNKGKTYWNLQNYSIQKNFLFELLEKLKEGPKSPQYIDLVGNRLDDIEKGDFKELFTMLCDNELHHISLRLGYEIFIPYYNKALQEMSTEDKIILDERIGYHLK